MLDLDRSPGEARAARRQQLQRRRARVGRPARARRPRERGGAHGALLADRRTPPTRPRTSLQATASPTRATTTGAAAGGRGGARRSTADGFDVRRCRERRGFPPDAGLVVLAGPTARAAPGRGATRSTPTSRGGGGCSCSRIRPARARWPRCSSASASCSRTTSWSTSARRCSAPTASPPASPS